MREEGEETEGHARVRKPSSCQPDDIKAAGK